MVGLHLDSESECCCCCVIGALRLLEVADYSVSILVPSVPVVAEIQVVPILAGFHRISTG